MVKTRLSIYEKAEVVICSAIYGDKVSCKRYGISLRSLYRYRDLARDPETELSQTVTKYANALRADERL